MGHIRLRNLTFLDENDEFGVETGDGNESDPITSGYNIGIVVGFAVLSVAFFCTGFVIYRLTRSCKEFYEWNAIRIIFPWISTVLALDCATLSFDNSRRANDDPDDPTDDSRSINRIWVIIIYIIQSTVAPGLFLVTFVITFLAYRTRSIPFFFVYRGPNPRVDSAHAFDVDRSRYLSNTDLLQAQQLVRPTTLVILLRAIALGFLVLSIIVNFNVLWSGSDLAGRTGWYTVVTELWDPSDSSHIVLSLVPISAVGIICIYFSLLLWRYGTLFSMIIYPSSLNPWFTPVLGTGFLLGGQWFGPDLFPIMSNLGIWLYEMSLLWLMNELRQEVKLSREIGDFLSAVGNDQVAGHVVVPANHTDVGTAGEFGEVSTKRFGPMDDDAQSNVSSLPSVSLSTTSNHNSNKVAPNVEESSR